MNAAAAIARYHALIERDVAAAEDQERWLYEAFATHHVTYGGAPMQTFLRPHFVASGEWNALREGGRRLLELAARVARTAFSGDVARLGAFLGTPEAEMRWVSLDPGPPDVVLSRVDAFLSPACPRFIEINSDAPAGFGYGDRMAALFQELPLFQAFAREVPVAYQASSPGLLAALLAEAAAAGAPSPTVAIADWAEVKTRADQEILQQELAAAGIACLLADPREMELVNGRLVAFGTPIDVVYRRAVLSELVEREADVADFLEAYRRGAARFVNTFRCRLSEDKAFFALLTDERFHSLLSEEEIGFVARVVPWTRRVEERTTGRDGRQVDLVPHALAGREGLVLKPAHGYGGQSVLVGDETTPGDWEAAVTRALGEPWVVQERVTIPEEPFPVWTDGRLAIEPRKVNVNPFYAGGADVGAVTRMSRSSVINVSAGGGSTPVFVVSA
jgi:uncharacterized circularly permuted ATP-grasp superfamily protein